jgi:hypothetical protein
MKLFECQHCGQPLYFENTRCESCGRKLGYLPGKETMTALEPYRGTWRALADGSRYRCCANVEHGVCNWLVPATGAYASVHPWEDFSETWAHYFHMVDTLETAGAFGVRVKPKISKGGDLAATIDFDPHSATMERIIEAWLPLTFAVNSINRSMGIADLYPFVLPPPVIVKLAFIHERIHAASQRSMTGRGAQHQDAEQAGRGALRAVVAGLRRSVGSPVGKGERFARAVPTGWIGVASRVGTAPRGTAALAPIARRRRA